MRSLLTLGASRSGGALGGRAPASRAGGAGVALRPGRAGLPSLLALRPHGVVGGRSLGVPVAAFAVVALPGAALPGVDAVATVAVAAVLSGLAAAESERGQRRHGGSSQRANHRSPLGASRQALQGFVKAGIGHCHVHVLVPEPFLPTSTALCTRCRRSPGRDSTRSRPDGRSLPDGGSTRSRRSTAMHDHERSIARLPTGFGRRLPAASTSLSPRGSAGSRTPASSAHRAGGLRRCSTR